MADRSSRFALPSGPVDLVAVVIGDRQVILQALIAGLTVKTRPEAEQLLEVILKTHRDFLPSFYS